MKKYFRLTVILIIVCVVTYVFLEDSFFTKSNARKLVEEQRIALNDDFVLVDNEFSSALGFDADYYHTFTLIISPKDARRAIKSIKNSPKFIHNNDSINRMLYMRAEGRYTGQPLHRNTKQMAGMYESISSRTEGQIMHQLSGRYPSAKTEINLDLKILQNNGRD